jgi:hypothetical protein
MNEPYKSWSLCLLTVVILFALSAPALSGTSSQKEEKKKVEGDAYAATLVGVQGRAGGKSYPITIRIKGSTSDELVAEYLEMVLKKDRKELRRTLEKVQDLGSVSVDGFIGTDLAVVRERDTEQGKLIGIVTARNLPFIELYYGGRSLDYPFSFIQLLIEKEGKGQGTVILAAKPSFNEDGILEIESFGLQPFQLFNVSKW